MLYRGRFISARKYCFGKMRCLLMRDKFKWNMYIYIYIIIVRANAWLCSVVLFLFGRILHILKRE